MPTSSETGVKEVWTSRTAFLYATAAAAIGLGSLWRFPYVAGANGGGAFVLVFMGFVLAICLPLMIAEMALGRRGHGSVMGTVKRLIADSGASSHWRLIGMFGLLIPFFGLSYYSVVAGWGVDYAFLAISRGFEGITGDQSRTLFEDLMASPVQQCAVQFSFIAAVSTVVARGVQRGIEVVSRIKIIALFVVLVGLVFYNAFTMGLGPAFDFLVYPDFSALTSESVLTALGQALFSTAIGVGVLMTYSAYLPKGVSIPGSTAIISGSVIFISMMAGLAIFPSVLHYGLTPAEGPNLIFVTLPVAFGGMPGGYVVSIAFFLLIVLAAFTTAVGMLEPVVAWLMERTGRGRAPLAYATGFCIWLVGLPSLLSFSVLKDARPLAWFGPFADKNFFQILDFTIADFLLPLNALLIALFAGWALRHTLKPVELDLQPGGYRIWRFLVAIIAPVAIFGLMIDILS